MTFDVSKLDARLRLGAAELGAALGFGVSEDDGLPLTAYISEGAALRVARGDNRVEVMCPTVPAFFKGLAAALGGGACADGAKMFERLGAMLDCSRNGVLSVDGAKAMIRYLAGMGYDYLMLYTEDTIEVPGYPYFGHLRGRYSAGELKELDGYCGLFGMELVPCVQTLAHLNQALRWSAFADIRDIGDILLMGEEKTYAFIDSLIASCAGAFTSRRIHIGMDEAHLVGLGKYLDIHGYRNRVDALLEHLGRVADICRKYGFAPMMMWSDMFFRLAFGSYYNAGEGENLPDVRAKIPQGVSMVYWDYYSLDKARYANMFDKHKALGDNTVFACGAWSWGGFMPVNCFSMAAAEAAFPVARDMGIADVFVTNWGDDGAETSPFAALPAFMRASELHYGLGAGEGERAQALFGVDINGLLLADTPFPLPAQFGQFAPDKYILYQDPLTGMFERHVNPEMAALCAKSAADIRAALPAMPERFKGLFLSQALLREALADKCCLGADIRAAYRAGDKDGLRRIAEVRIPALVSRVQAFHKAFRAQWLAVRKPFGLEVQDIRLGGLAGRLTAAAQTLADYADGKTAGLPELEEEPLPYNPKFDNDYAREIVWREIVTAGVVSHT